MKKLTTGFILAACLSIVFLLSTPAALNAAGIAEGATITSLPELKDAGGGQFSTADLKDRYTAFIFFSIYSDGTADVLKYFNDIRKRPVVSSKMRIVGVNIDPSVEALDDFLRKNRVQFRVLLDVSLEMSNRFSVRRTPSLFILDPDMTVRLAVTGFSTDSLNEIDSKLMDTISGSAPKNRSASYKPDDNDKNFMDKKLVGANSRFSRFCASNDKLLLYVAEDGSLFQFSIKDMARKLLATDTASADWSPDCSAVVFAQKEKSGLWLKKLNGSAEEIAPWGKNPLWSPRNDFIAFLVGEDVWVYQIATQKRWQIGADIKTIQWSPEGSLILMTDRKGRAWLASPFSHASIIERIFK